MGRSQVHAQKATANSPENPGAARGTFRRGLLTVKIVAVFRSFCLGFHPKKLIVSLYLLTMVSVNIFF
jgi:hypothetical protein